MKVVVRLGRWDFFWIRRGFAWWVCLRAYQCEVNNTVVVTIYLWTFKAL